MNNVDELIVGCSLSIEVQSGTDKLGDPIYKKKTFSMAVATVYKS